MRHVLVGVGLAFFSVMGCGDDDGTSGDVDSGGGGGADTGPAGVPEPDLARACEPTPACPPSLTCMLDLGCIVPTCPSVGPGADHGCPSNGFCYAFDGATEGYCARICTTDADCTAVNPALVCRERAAGEPFGIMICDLP